MPFWVFQLTNPLIITIYYLIFEGVLKIISAIQHKHFGIDFKWRLLIYALLVLISTAMHFKLLFTDEYRKSLVDASPLSSLSSEQINRLDEVLWLFEEYEFITQFEFREREDHLSLSKVCVITWHRNNPFGGLNIRVHFYIDEQEAIESMRSREEGRRHTSVSYINNIEATLFDSRMNRGGHGVPVPWRHLYSRVRLGNAVIYLSENPQQHQLHMNISNDFIKLLCELLSTEQKI